MSVDPRLIDVTLFKFQTFLKIQMCDELRPQKRNLRLESQNTFFKLASPEFLSIETTQFVRFQILDDLVSELPNGYP